MDKKEFEYKIVNENPQNAVQLLVKSKTLGENITINGDLLFLRNSIYGNNKKETNFLQKQNCKIVRSCFKKVVRLIRKLKRKRVEFSNIIYIVCNGYEPQSSNADLLVHMLNIKFFGGFFNKLPYVLNKACEYFDSENGKYKMCDFRDNSCYKMRELGSKRVTCCCPQSCKFMQAGPCKTKNISCKIIMCDKLEERGFYFSPLYNPILAENLTFFQRVCVYGLFFRSFKSTVRILRLVKFLTYFIIFLIPYLTILNFI